MKIHISHIYHNIKYILDNPKLKVNFRGFIKKEQDFRKGEIIIIHDDIAKIINQELQVHMTS